MNGGPAKWTLLDSFNSEAEARVVESFLSAQGFEVQLLDTHMHRLLPAHGAGDFSGMRMMIRAEQFEEAQKLLVESRRPTHLDLAEQASQKIPAHSASKVLWSILVLIAIAATILATKMF